MRTLLRKLRWSLTQRGLIGTLRAVPATLTRTSSATVQHPFDELYGTDTSGLIGGGSLATGHPHDTYITGYAGVPPSRFEAAIDRWRSTIAPARIDDYTFIDLGCGKGRALLLASRLPFRQVSGVELNTELASIAQHNADRWQTLGQPVSPIRIRVGDATEPSLPSGPTLVFLYNPFSGPLVHRLANHLCRATESRPLDLIYQNADHSDAFKTQLGFRELSRTTLPLSVEDASVDPVASPADMTVFYRIDI